jgi:hypothetical protein
MSLDAELADLGEPPVSALEAGLIAVLDQFLALRESGQSVSPTDLLSASPDLTSEGTTLLQVAECLEEFVSSIMQQSGLEDVAWPPTEMFDKLPDPFPGLYRVRQFLGEGRFSRVWLADHLSLDIPIALKTLHFHILGEEREVALALLRNEARIQAQALASVTLSGTPAYMAPEVWRGKASKYSDQYSLAYAYAELRLGHRAFASTDIASTMHDHLDSTPNLEALPEAEKLVLLKALAKQPEARFPTCVEFVRALEAATRDGIAPCAASPGARRLNLWQRLIRLFSSRE